MPEGRVTTATVLFCDLVGSTAQRTALGDDVADRLAAVLDVMLRDTVAYHHGSVVKSTGDGLMAIFEATSDALNAAVAVHQGSELHNRRAAEGERLVLRVGMSAGDVHFVANDCHGTAVVEAARLESAADPGTIFVSGLVRALAGSRGGHRFEEVGTLELKGLDPVEVFRAHWDPPRPQGTIALPWRMELGPRSGVVARASERDVLLDAATGAADGEGRRVVLVGGEAGVGKTTLVADVARTAHERGMSVLYGGCDEDVSVPYRPFVEALRYFVVHAPDEWLRSLDVHGLSQLVRLVPELGGRCPDLPAIPATDPDAERYLLFGATAALLAQASGIEPLVVILDDLHWADRPTLHLLRHLVSSPLGRVLLVGTYRDVELTQTHPLTEALGTLVREPGVERLPIRGFGQDAVVTFMEAVAGHELDEGGRNLARLLWRETDGNPLFVSEMLRNLAETGALVRDATGQWRATVALNEAGLPDTVRAVVRARAARLDDGAIAALSAASVIGRTFDLGVLARVTGDETDGLLDVMDRAGELAIVTETRDAPGQFRFRHSLVQQTFYQDLGSTRRRSLHRRVADALDGSGADGGAHVVELAQHLVEAGDLADPDRRREACRRAGQHALELLAPDEAVRWFTLGLEIADAHDTDPVERCSLLLGLGVAQRDAGSVNYRDTLREAGALARSLGSADLMAGAALANFRGFWSTSGAVDEERIDELAAARAALGDRDHPITARIIATTSVELLYGDDEENRLALAEEALAMGRRLDHPPTLAYLLRTWDLVHRLPWFLDARSARSGEHLELAHGLGDPVERFWALNNASVLALEQADAARFAELTHQVLPAARATGQRLLEWIGGFVAVNEHIIRCDWEPAEALMERTHQLGVECGQPDADAVYASHLFELRRAQGRADELVDLLQAVVEVSPEIEAFRPALGVCYCDLDLFDGRALFEEDAADGFARYRPNGQWLISMMMNAEIACFLGHREAAESLRTTLSPWRDQIAWTGTTAGRCVAGTVGDLATLLGHFDEADAELTHALEVHRGFAAPAWVAGTLIALARLHTTRRAPGDDDRAHRAVTEARELARSLGSATVERKVAEVAARI
jgi:class 3 adenylate cyclase